MQKIIDQSYLKSILHYCPISGDFTWSCNFSRRIRSGTKAGTVYQTCSGKKYRVIAIHKKHYRAHHLAWLYMTGEMPTDTIDHANGNGIDNSFKNLDHKSLADNQKNKRLQSNNKSGISGVYYRKDKKRWIACIKTNSICQHLISSFDFFEACCARKSAERRLGFHENHGQIRPL